MTVKDSAPFIKVGSGATLVQRYNNYKDDMI